MCVDFIHPVIDNQIRYHSTVDRVLARVVLINLYRKISVCIARIQIVVGHEFGVLIGRLLQAALAVRDKARVAIVIHQLYGFSVHRLIEDVAIAGGRREVLAHLARQERLVVANGQRMGVLKVDTHALERDLFPLLIGHLVGIARDLDFLKHLTHGDRKYSVAALPYLLRTTASVLRNHLGRDHNRHVAFGERIRINEHHMVAPKEHGLEIGVAKRVVRQ